MARFDELPPEILGLIFERFATLRIFEIEPDHDLGGDSQKAAPYKSRQRALVGLCQQCKYFREVAEPLLYHTFIKPSNIYMTSNTSYVSRTSLRFNGHRSNAYKHGSKSNTFLRRFLRTLRDRPDLIKCVKFIIIAGWTGANALELGATKAPEHGPDLMRSPQSLIQYFSSLESLIVDENTLINHTTFGQVPPGHSVVNLVSGSLHELTILNITSYMVPYLEGLLRSIPKRLPHLRLIDLASGHVEDVFTHNGTQLRDGFARLDAVKLAFGTIGIVLSEVGIRDDRFNEEDEFGSDDQIVEQHSEEDGQNEPDYF